MKVTILIVLLAGFVSLTGQPAVARSENTKRLSTHEESMRSLELLGKVHNYNEVFGNYHLGGLPYDDLAKEKKGR